MSKKYVSYALANEDKLPIYIKEGNITVDEYWEYFGGDLPSSCLYTLFKTEDDIKKYFEVNPVMLSKRDGYVEFVCKNVKAGILKEDYFYDNFFFKGDGYEEKYYVKYMFKNLDDFFQKFCIKMHAQPKQLNTYLQNSKVRKYAVEMLRQKKITFVEYKTKFPTNYTLGVISRKSINTLEEVFLSKNFDFGDVSKYKFNELEQKLFTTKKIWEDPVKFKLLRDHFLWDKISCVQYLNLEFILQNLDKLDLSSVIRHNKRLTIDWLIAHKEELGQVSLEAIYGRHGDFAYHVEKRKWAFEEIEELVNVGLIYINKDSEPTEIIDELGERVYKLGYLKHLNLKLPYIEGFNSDDYQKLVSNLIEDYLNTCGD